MIEILHFKKALWVIDGSCMKGVYGPSFFVNKAIFHTFFLHSHPKFPEPQENLPWRKY